MIDDTAVEVRKYLRYLLRETGIEGQRWFWYAEAKVYAEPLQWRPLLGVRLRNGIRTSSRRRTWFDVADGTGSTPAGGWYDRYSDATGKGDVLSVVNELETQFQGRTEILKPVLGVFACNHKGPCNKGGTCSDYRKVGDCVRRATVQVPFFTYLPNPDGDENHRKRYCNYVNNVLLQIKYCADGALRGKRAQEGYVYPRHALVVGLPMYVVDGGAPCLLASMILILETEPASATENALIKHILKVVPLVADLRRRGSVELSQRFHGGIEGLYTGSTPVALLAHPAWTRRQNIAIMQMQGQEHDELSALGFAGLSAQGAVSSTPPTGDQLRKNHLWARVFQRNLERFRAIPAGAKNGEEPAPEHIGLWAGQEGPNLQTFLGEGFERKYRDVFCKAIHRWLKALYSHRSEAQWNAVAPSRQNYELRPYHMYWLATLIEAEIGKLDATSKCDWWPKKEEGRPAGVFEFPVTPGARFLIPWLSMAGHMAGLDQVRRLKVHIVLTGDGSFPRLAENRMVASWLWARTRQESSGRSGARKCALLLEMEGQGALLDAVAGWRRVLYQPSVRRGGDSGALADVLSCNAENSFRKHGLPVDPTCGLFEPIDTGGLLSLDIESSFDGANAQALIAFSWERA